jgi:predicted RecB family nuclease
MQILGNDLVFSPHDLTAFLEGDFAAWMDRRYFEARRAGSTPGEGVQTTMPPWLVPDAQDEETALIAKKGIAHESKFLASLMRDTPGLVQITGPQAPKRTPEEAFRQTMAAMKATAPVIYQGCLRGGGLFGIPDFLFKVAGPCVLGQHHYEPWDTKLAKSARPSFVIQLSAYAEMLEVMQGRRPMSLTFVLGDDTKLPLPTDKFFFYYCRFKRSFLAFQERFDPKAMPEPSLDRGYGRWNRAAEEFLEKTDHVSRVARITRTQMKRMEAAGICTMSELAVCKKSVPRLQPETLTRLKAQATLQIQSRGKAKPVFQVIPQDPEDPRRGLALLPPPSPSDVFFDMEGFPLAQGGLEYLFGAVILQKGKPEFHDWWAHDAIEERKAFEQFVDWVYARWKADPTLHIYHYAAYESSALRRLMGKFASREREVDDLLRNGVLVDLYTVVRQGVLIGTPGYSLKDIECLFMAPREGAVISASGSVVAYQRWLDSGQTKDWKQAPILKEIRDYNCVDCESTVYLRDWLHGLQNVAGLRYLSEKEVADAEEAEGEVRVPPVAAQLCQKLLEVVASGAVMDEERQRVQELLAWLLEFHWREAKPVFWRMFDRHKMTEQELIDDLDCLGGLGRTKRPRQAEARSWLFEYRFDPDQDTKLHDGCKCFFAHDLDVHTEIVEFDGQNGRLVIKLGPKAPAAPARLSLIPDEYVSAKSIAAAILRYVEAWAKGQVLSRAVDDLLCRRAPRIKKHTGGAIMQESADSLPQIVDVVSRLDGTTLCIQGPPGTGKTYTCGAVIADLLRKGKKIGVTAISHKAILNIMHAIHEAMGREHVKASLYKVGDHCDDSLVKNGSIKNIVSAKAVDVVGSGPVVVGGTAWLFSRPELAQEFDYLFVDEAGQFSLANAVAVGISARNLILVGDQMQLSQPIQGSHPGESGMSALDYLLNGHATIPPDFGVFLGVTRRLHPDVCRFISDAVYEGRLHAHPSTAHRSIAIPKKGIYVTRPTGIQFVPVEHEGNAQCSDEEVDVIAKIIAELLKADFVDTQGKPRKMTLDDILLVAPYNMQVRRLQKRFGAQARVGSVDKFQGQEAAAVVVSMCASSIEDCPRGAEFLLNPNRLNVAVSRAKCLAVVVGCPSIMTARCQTLGQMELVNLFCHLADYSQGLATS